jgi:hypothetical protein
MPFARAVTFAALFVVVANAQEPPVQEPVATPPAALRLARIVPAEVSPRCFASERSPVFSDRLTNGQVVRVGEAVGGFVPVVVPMGVTGYVHEKYCTPPEQGVVRTTGARVSFRYRPQSSEAPVQLVAKDTELFFLASEADWLKVRHPGAPAYLAEADVQIVSEPDATLEASLREHELQRRAAWQEAAAKREAEIAETKARQERMAALDAIEQRLAAEAGKPAEQRQFDPVRGDLTALAATLPKDSEEAARAALLVGKLDEQELLVRAIKAVAEEPRRADPVPIGTPPVADALSRFDAIGWVRYRRAFDGREEVTLEKGGRVLHVLQCSSGRYDLRLFDGAEIGVVGPRERRVAESVRVLDALKIEVLGTR